MQRVPFSVFYYKLLINITNTLMSKTHFNVIAGKFYVIVWMICIQISEGFLEICLFAFLLMSVGENIAITFMSAQ